MEGREVKGIIVFSIFNFHQFGFVSFVFSFYALRIQTMKQKDKLVKENNENTIENGTEKTRKTQPRNQKKLFRDELCFLVLVFLSVPFSRWVNPNGPTALGRRWKRKSFVIAGKSSLCLFLSFPFPLGKKDSEDPAITIKRFRPLPTASSSSLGGGDVGFSTQRFLYGGPSVRPSFHSLM